MVGYPADQAWSILKVTPVTGEEKKKSGFVPKSHLYSEELLRVVKEAEEDGASGKQ